MSKKESINRSKQIILSFLYRLILFGIIIWLMFGLVFGIAVMKNTHMQPSINASDLMLYYRLEQKYDSSDVVVFKRDDEEYIGRIVAVTGDKVNITNDSRLEVNDNIVVENRIYYSTPKYGDNVNYPLEVSDEQYFILGDYREGSKDSRYFGLINTEEIKGKVITLVRRNNI